VDGVLREASRFEQVMWSHSRREFNSLAHVIAYFDVPISKVWLNEFPLLSVSLAAHDVN